MQFEIPCLWDTSTDIDIELHVYVNDTFAPGDVRMQWQGVWEAIPSDGTEPVGGATHSGTLDSGDIDIEDVANDLVEIVLGTISAGDLAVNDTITILLSRIALDGAGANPANNPVVILASFGFVIDKLGLDTL